MESLAVSAPSVHVSINISVQVLTCAYVSVSVPEKIVAGGHVLVYLYVCISASVQDNPKLARCKTFFLALGIPLHGMGSTKKAKIFIENLIVGTRQ